MRLVWTNAAVIDLEQISDYLFEMNPELAIPTIQRIFESTSQLKLFSQEGPHGSQRRHAGAGSDAVTLSCCV
jgi:plasmid stabilization system protein ParE